MLVSRRTWLLFNKWVPTIILLSALASLPAGIDAESLSGDAALYKSLMDSYVPARPRKRPSEIVVVEASFVLNQILSLDGRNGIFTILALVNLAWHDDYLQWNPADFDNVTSITIQADRIWTPNIGILNSATTSVNPYWRVMQPAQIEYDGYTTWPIMDTFSTLCPVNMTLFPFDTQKCAVLLSCLRIKAEEVKLVTGSSAMNTNAGNKSEEFELLSTRKPYEYSTSPSGVISISYNFHLKRRPLYYVLNVLGPCAVLYLLSLMAFCLPMSSGERISLQLTALLSISVYQLIITSMVPITSFNIPVLTVSIFSATVLNSMSVIGNIVSIRLNEPHENRMGPLMRGLVLGCLGKITCIAMKSKKSIRTSGTLGPVEPQGGGEMADQAGEGNNTSGGSNHDNYVQEESEEEYRQQEWHVASVILDRFLFVLFLSMTIAFFIFGYVKHI